MIRNSDESANQQCIPNIAIVGRFNMCRRKTWFCWRWLHAFVFLAWQVCWSNGATPSISGLCDHAQWTPCPTSIVIPTLHRHA